MSGIGTSIKSHDISTNSSGEWIDASSKLVQLDHSNECNANFELSGFNIHDVDGGKY